MKRSDNPLLALVPEWRAQASLLATDVRKIAAAQILNEWDELTSLGAIASLTKMVEEFDAYLSRFDPNLVAQAVQLRRSAGATSL